MICHIIGCFSTAGAAALLLTMVLMTGDVHSSTGVPRLVLWIALVVAPVLFAVMGILGIRKLVLHLRRHESSADHHV